MGGIRQGRGFEEIFTVNFYGVFYESFRIISGNFMGKNGIHAIISHESSGSHDFLYALGRKEIGGFAACAPYGG